MRLVNLSAHVFVFGGCNVHHNDWLTYSGGADRLDELCYNFSISNDLTQMINFPALLGLSISSDASICSTMPFPPSGKYRHVVPVSIDFPTDSKWNALFYCVFLCWLGQSLWSFERCSMERYLYSQCFYCCHWILCVGSGWNWCI